MKVVLAGVTGFIGQAVFKACLANQAITSLVLLSRRALPEYSPLRADYAALQRNPDLVVEVIVLDSFTTYSDEVLGHLATADAGIWCIGTYHGDAAADVEYPGAYRVAQLKASGSRSFRYVHLGGAFTEHDQARTLWFMPQARKVRGRAETEASQFAVEQAGTDSLWETHVVKPAWVMPFATASGTQSWNASSVLSKLIGENWCVPAEDVAAMMVDLAVNGGGDDGGGKGASNAHVWLNKDVVQRGLKALLELQARQ